MSIWSREQLNDQIADLKRQLEEARGGRAFYAERLAGAEKAATNFKRDLAVAKEEIERLRAERDELLAAIQKQNGQAQKAIEGLMADRGRLRAGIEQWEQYFRHQSKVWMDKAPLTGPLHNPRSAAYLECADALKALLSPENEDKK